jgi:hypothetical protein
MVPFGLRIGIGWRKVVSGSHSGLKWSSTRCQPRGNGRFGSVRDVSWVIKSLK